MTLTPSDIASRDVGYWADYSEIQLQVGKFSFLDHEYQLGPLESKARRKCYIKATGGGFSEMEILDSIHGARYNRYPQGVLYLFPTNDDMIEFSKSRFNPLISANRHSIGRFVKSTDMASLKKIGTAFLYLRGARLTQTVGGEFDAKESAKLRSIQVDIVKFDEVDLMDEEVRTKALNRMGHSKVKGERYISNPTLPDFGIDRIYQESDQRNYFNRCGCGTWTSALQSFPKCVKIRPDGTGYIGCDKCGKEIVGRTKGEWVPAVRDNSDYMEGYRWSHLNSKFNDPAEILDNYTNPPRGNLSDVYRLRLGLAHVSHEDKLRISQVLECCNNDLMSNSFAGQCAMGVDIGKKYRNIVIGIRTGKDRYELLKIARVPDWSSIHDMARRFNVKSAVVDIRPYEDSARQFQKSEPYRVFLCEYTDNPMHDAVWNDVTKTVKAHRTGAFDTTHRIISEGKLVIPRECPEIIEFAKQCCATAKILEVNKKTGTSLYRYVKLGKEDYRNALNYFYLAASGSKIARSDKVKPKAQTADNNYVRV